MALLVSVRIDGDASGVKAAATEAASAMHALDRETAKLATTQRVATAALGTADYARAQKAVAGLSFEAKNLSYQLVDVAQGIMLGQSPMMIMMQQGGQLAQIFAMSPKGVAGLMKEVGSAIRGIITPMTALGLAGGGLAAVGYGIYASWKTSAIALDDAARAAGVTIGQMRRLEAAAANKGIAAGEFADAMRAFAAQVYQAQQGTGTLATLLRANGKEAKGFAETFDAVADLIKNAGSEQQRLNLLQQAGFQATSQMVRFMSQGAADIRLQGREISAAEQRMIDAARRADEAWVRFWDKFSRNAKAAFVETADGLTRVLETRRRDEVIRSRQGGTQAGRGRLSTSPLPPMSGVIDHAFEATDRFYKPALIEALERRAAGLRGGSTVDPTNAKIEAAQLQQRLGLLGETARIEEVLLGLEKQIKLARNDGIAISVDEEALLKRLAAERALGITQIKTATDAQRVEAATIDMGLGRAAAYGAAQNALNEARRAGRVLTAGNIAAIEAEAAALGRATQATAEMRLASEIAFERAQLGRTESEAAIATRLKAVYGGDYARAMTGAAAAQMRLNEQIKISNDLIADAATGSVRDFVTELRNGAKAWDALGTAGLNALSRITDKLLDMAAKNLAQQAFGGVNLFGWIGGAVGAAGKGGEVAAFGMHGGGIAGKEASFRRLVHPAYFEGAPRFHSGKAPWGAGEMPAIIRTDEGVFTPAQMKALGGAASTSARAPVVNIYPAAAGETFDVRQNEDGSLDLIGRMVDQKLSAYDRDVLPARVHAISNRPRYR